MTTTDPTSALETEATVSVQEAVALMGLTEYRIRSWIRDDCLPATKESRRRYRIKVRDLNEAKAKWPWLLDDLADGAHPARNVRRPSRLKKSRFGVSRDTWLALLLAADQPIKDGVGLVRDFLVSSKLGDGSPTPVPDASPVPTAPAPPSVSLWKFLGVLLTILAVAGFAGYLTRQSPVSPPQGPSRVGIASTTFVPPLVYVATPNRF